MKAERPYHNHFLSSDHHFFHEKSIKFDNRPFKSVEHMHEEIIKRHNSVVPENGLTYFLGDVGMGSSEQLASIINRMNGVKILVAGNHDGSVGKMMKSGFLTVVQGVVLRLDNKLVTLSHCPLRGIPREQSSPEMLAKGMVTINWHGEEKNQFYSMPDFGQALHCHGHLHAGKNTPWKPIQLGNQLDIGVVGNHFRPVSFSHVESVLMKLTRSQAQA